MPVEAGAASPTRFAVGRLGHHRGGGGGEPPRALVSGSLFCAQGGAMLRLCRWRSEDWVEGLTLFSTFEIMIIIIYP